jgi:hypothetical protein
MTSPSPARVTRAFSSCVCRVGPIARLADLRINKEKGLLITNFECSHWRGIAGVSYIRASTRRGGGISRSVPTFRKTPTARAAHTPAGGGQFIPRANASSAFDAVDGSSPRRQPARVARMEKSHGVCGGHSENDIENLRCMRLSRQHRTEFGKGNRDVMHQWSKRERENPFAPKRSKRGLFVGTRLSGRNYGHLPPMCRINRPHTWPHRPKDRASKYPCQRRAVHTWRKAEIGSEPLLAGTRRCYP